AIPVAWCLADRAELVVPPRIFLVRLPGEEEFRAYALGEVVAVRHLREDDNNDERHPEQSEGSQDTQLYGILRSFVVVACPERARNASRRTASNELRRCVCHPERQRGAWREGWRETYLSCRPRLQAPR